MATHPTLDVPKHTKYFLRTLKTFLPTAYQSNDSNRMSLAFFTLSGLDLLGTLEQNTTEEQRTDYIDWIYSNQHPNGGFRAFPGAHFGHARTEENEHWDPANLPATFFALCSLLILNDDLSRVKRKESLQWLTSLQRPDGSFGETLVKGKINGGTDSRFGYCATGVRYILRGTFEGEVEGCPDIELDNFVTCIRSAETYDGGISDAPYHEAHAGFTYCAIGALSNIDRLPPKISAVPSAPSPKASLTNPPLLIKWLVSRQTATICEEDDLDTYGDETDTAETCHDAHSFVFQDDFVSEQGKMNYEGRPSVNFSLDWTGFNGRCNKIADTCYAFWVHGSLSILGQSQLPRTQSLKRWLLERTVHPQLGGFGKIAGDLPDLYHSYLGLAALSLLGEEKLKPLDASLCLSVEAKDRLKSIWKRWGIEQ
ncbi:terpenoid cyclases/Protein prenyltransferase [Aureobasidium subglaciale]|nr:terpenoid cyclases/Protein prenyltransferase [Aureobasidium subglaciale]